MGSVSEEVLGRLLHHGEGGQGFGDVVGAAWKVLAAILAREISTQLTERGFSTGLGLIPGQGLGCRRRGKGFPRKAVGFWAPSGAVLGCDPEVMLQGWVQPLTQPSSMPRGGRCPKQAPSRKGTPRKGTHGSQVPCGQHQAQAAPASP